MHFEPRCDGEAFPRQAGAPARAAVQRARELLESGIRLNAMPPQIEHAKPALMAAIAALNLHRTNLTHKQLTHSHAGLAFTFRSYDAGSHARVDRDTHESNMKVSLA